MKRLKTIFFLILILTSNISLAFGATNEGYGEDSQALGQFVDSFENDNNVSVAYQVINNVTLGVMELNYTSTTPSDENYTTYTELDPNGRFAVSDNIIVVNSLSNWDRDHRITYDYGVGFFRDFTHDLEARARDDSGSAGNDRMWVWLLANVTDDAQDMIDNNDEYIGLKFYEFDASDPNSPDIAIIQVVNGVSTADKYEPATLNTWYYFRIVKSGTSLICGIYSTSVLRDAGDGTDGDIDNLAMTLDYDFNFRYIYAVGSQYSGFSSTRLISGDIHNLSIGIQIEGYDPNGYFNTTDYLLNPLVDGSVLAHQTIADIPSNTAITIQFSPNGTDWYNNLGAIGSNSLTDGLNTFELRPLNYSIEYSARFNLSTTDYSITPRLNQSKLITTIGDSTGGGAVVSGGGINSATLLMIIFLCILAITLLWRFAK